MWRSRRMFVTSTFRDMHAERDYLRHSVFPILEERLRSRVHHLEPIDLRWGVETTSVAEQESKEALVIKVCLGEIERSRPFLIALLGDRYGWVPPRERMSAAAEEAGYQGVVSDRSVTALEIEFGVLSAPDQRQRSHFYFRDPLPYDAMDAATAAQYSDAHSTDADVRAGHARLVALKAEIESTMRRLGQSERVRHYCATWDAERQLPAGLEAWGAQVVEDLWRDLDEETRASIQRPSESWQDQERAALDAFVELGCRDFCGRDGLLDKLEAFALSTRPAEAAWAACLTGAAGSGKSAIVAMLSRRLSSQALVLTHAAGISPRSTDVDGLLRRWSEELASALGIPDPTAGLTARGDVEAAFVSLLSRASTTRRVVCLVDALNQFERAPSAMYMTWLPRVWPENARMIATAIPGIESAAMARRAGVVVEVVPSLGGDEARAITTTLCARYHKRLHQEVERALVSKMRAEGVAAAGNPLWLTLGVEELLLLDADDFARAEQQFSGSSEQKLHALLLDTAARLPADIEGLYEYLLTRNEEVHGAGWARGFAELIAVTRHGLREIDLQALLPAACGGPWDPLRFAALRRSFRAHLAQRGVNLQWDFVHPQMRTAVERAYFSDPADRRRLHSALADHLQQLPREDPVRETELMVHYIGAEDLLRAAQHYGDRSLGEAEIVGATRALAATILQSPSGSAWHRPSTLLSAARDRLQPAEVATLCARFALGVVKVLADDTDIRTRLEVLDDTESCLLKLDASNCPGPASEALTFCRFQLGKLFRAQGNLGSALTAFEGASRASADAWQRGRFDSPAFVSVVAEILDSMGEIHMQRGDNAAAADHYRRSLAALQVTGSARAVPGQIALGNTHNRLGEALRQQGRHAEALEQFEAAGAGLEAALAGNPGQPELRAALAGSRGLMGDTHVDQARLDEALADYGQALAIMESLLAFDPANRHLQAFTANYHSRISAVFLSRHQTDAAIEHHQQCLRLREALVAADATNAEYQRDLSVSRRRLGDILLERGESAAALELYEGAVTVRAELVERDSGNRGWRRDLALAHEAVGDAFLSQGEYEKARREKRKALDMFSELVAQDASNDVWQRDLERLRATLSECHEPRGVDAASVEDLQAEVSRLQALGGPANSADVGRALIQTQFALSGRLRASGDERGGYRQWNDAWGGIALLRKQGAPLGPQLEELVRRLVAGPAEELRRNAEAFRAAGHRQALIPCLRDLAELRWRCGEASEALALLGEQAQCCRETGASLDLVNSLLRQSEMLIRDLRQPSEAIPLLEDAMRVMTMVPDKSLEWQVRARLDSARAMITTAAGASGSRTQL